MTTFYFDRKNVGFQPGKSPLDFKLVHGDSIGVFGAFFITILALPMFLLILVSIFSNAVTEIGFLRQGVTTDATIESCEHTRSSGRASDRTELSYSYFSADGQITQETVTIVNDFIDCDTVPVGDAVQIQYIPNSVMPESRVVDSRLRLPFLNALLLPCVVVMGLMVIGGFVFVGVRSLFRYVRALRWIKRLPQGKVLNGVIVECHGDFEGKHNTLFHVYVRYRFTSPQGVALSRRQVYRRDDLIEKLLPTPGTPVKVLYVSDTCHVML